MTEIAQTQIGGAALEGLFAGSGLRPPPPEPDAGWELVNMFPTQAQAPPGGLTTPQQPKLVHVLILFWKRELPEEAKQAAPKQSWPASLKSGGVQ